MKTILTLLLLCTALNAHGATYFLLSQTNTFANNITKNSTNSAKSYVDPLLAAKLDTPTVITLTHAGTVTLTNTAWLTKAYLAPTGYVTFATASLTAGHDYVVYGRNLQATNITLTFPQNGGTNAWQFQGGAISTIPTGQTFTLSLSSVGTVDTNVWAAISIIQ